MHVRLYVLVLIMHVAVSEIFGLTSQLAIQSCLGCYKKLNFGCKFHIEVATHIPHIKFITLYTLNIIL